MTITTPAVFFDGPRQCSVREQALEWPLPDRVLVRSQLTLISTGTELWRIPGRFPVGGHGAVPLYAGLRQYRGGGRHR